MARPKKEKELKRSHQIMLRLNDTEYDVISEYAKHARLPLAEFARKQLTTKKVDVKYEIVADVPELKKLITEFNRIGNNLNQIARHFNIQAATGSLYARHGEPDGIPSQTMRKAVSQCITEILRMKQEVLKMAGDFYGNTETHSS